MEYFNRLIPFESLFLPRRTSLESNPPISAPSLLSAALYRLSACLSSQGWQIALPSASGLSAGA